MQATFVCRGVSPQQDLSCGLTDNLPHLEKTVVEMPTLLSFEVNQCVDFSKPAEVYHELLFLLLK